MKLLTIYKLSGYLLDLYLEARSLDARIQDSWGKLLSTDGYKADYTRMNDLYNEFRQRLSEFILENHPTAVQYRIVPLGSDTKIDVQNKRKQAFYVNVIFGDDDAA